MEIFAYSFPCSKGVATLGAHETICSARDQDQTLVTKCKESTFPSILSHGSYLFILDGKRKYQFW